jgi:hypothetical protein
VEVVNVGFPLFNLDTPTHIVVQWGWYLLTWGNFVVYVLLAAVFVVGITIRLPGTKRELAQAKHPDAPAVRGGQL